MEHLSDIKSELENTLIEVARSKNIKNYALKTNANVEVGDGFVADFYTGEITDKDSNKITYVAIKKAPIMDWDMTDVFANEITFYDSIFPAFMSMQKEVNLLKPFDNAPKLFCLRNDPEEKYLAMENLKIQGYVLYDKKKCLDKEHLEFIFRVYGKFHALSFVLRKQNLEKYQDKCQEVTDLFNMFSEFVSGHLEIALTAAVATLDPKSAVYEEAKNLPKNIKATFLKESAYSGQYRCFTHGDCWSNNMLFKYSESGRLEDIKLIDFQLARESSPIHDLSYFFYSGASKTDIDAIEYYLKIYHNSLSEVIKAFEEDPEELISYEALIKEWKEYALFGVVLAIYLLPIKLLPKEEFVNAFKDPKHSTTKGREEFFTNVMNSAFRNDVFNERARSILIHAYEFGVLRRNQIVFEKAETEGETAGVF